MVFDEKMFDLMVGNIAGVNLSDGVQRLGGNKAKYLQILSLFLHSQVDAMEQLFSVDDNQQKAILVHSCKGAGSNIGANEIASSASVLEEKYLSGEAVTDDELQALKQMITTALASFTDIAGRIPEHVDVVVEEDIQPLTANLLEQLSLLQVCLEEFDIEVQDKLTVLTKKLPRWCSQLEEFKDLENSVIQFDFLTAQDHLKALKKKAS